MNTYNGDKTIILKNACIEFIGAYNPVLEEVDNYLDKHISQMSSNYAQAYEPWLNGLRDLCKGIFLLSKGIKLPRPERFLEALKMFSLECSVRFLHDLCKCCEFELEKNWQEKLLKDIQQINLITLQYMKTQNLNAGRQR